MEKREEEPEKRKNGGIRRAEVNKKREDDK